MRVVVLSSVTVPFAAWYEEQNLELNFPESWRVSVHRLQRAKSITDQEIEEALSNPIGSKPLSRIARGKRDAVIIVDDLTRPTPAHRLLPFILNELKKGGINSDDVRVVIGLGTHRPLGGVDLTKKLGSEITDNLDVINHNPYENLVYIGDSSRGTPIYLNGDVVDADVKIAVGSIIPHPIAGFGGGGKIVLPGCAGMETIEYIHSKIPRLGRFGRGIVEGNEFRNDLEEAVRKTKLDMILNVVINEKRQITKVFAGDFVEAHRAGVEFGRTFYKMGVLNKSEILIANSYPLDLELIQAQATFWTVSEATKKDGVVGISTAASEGLGYHLFFEKLRRRRRKGEKEEFGFGEERRLIVFSPNIGSATVKHIFPKAESVKTWNEVLEELKTYGRRLEATVLPSASIQYR
jgi:nickel-dependent lactate racemase